MQRALGNLGAAAWISGLRQRKAKSRQNLDVLLWRNGRGKVHPLIDWTDRDVFRYLTRHNLPYHPLWEQGYVSIGDAHHHPSTERRHERGSHPLLRPQARVRPARTRFIGAICRRRDRPR